MIRGILQVGIGGPLSEADRFPTLGEVPVNYS